MSYLHTGLLNNSPPWSHHFFCYGHDPRLPTEVALCPEERKKLTDLREYGSELAKLMSEAWELARDYVKSAQKRQKIYHDRKARPPQFLTGDRVFLYKLAEDRRGTEIGKAIIIIMVPTRS